MAADKSYGGCVDHVAFCRVLCDAALFDAKEMKWTSIEPTPFSRCAHSAVVVPGAPASASAAGALARNLLLHVIVRIPGSVRVRAITSVH